MNRAGDAVVMTDLRMGLEPDYFFRFQVGAVYNPRVVPVESRRLPVAQRLDRLGELWDRLRGAPVTTWTRLINTYWSVPSHPRIRS